MAPSLCRPRIAKQIAARYGVSGFLQQIGDAGHAYTAYASEMISFCHRITGRRIAVSETVTDLDANERGGVPFARVSVHAMLHHVEEQALQVVNGRNGPE